jgi:hypothetical protein
LAATQLGQIPETSAEPERAVYKVCYINQTQTPVLARMYGGGELAEDEEPALPPDQGEPIPVGTYIGTTDYPKVVENVFSPGQFSTNKVIINVAEDGTVSGSLSVFYIGDTFVREDNGCVKHWEIDVQGEFHGQLMGYHDSIGLTEKWICVLYAYCSDTGSCDDKPLLRQIDIQISGDQMTGTTRPHPEDPDVVIIWTLNAKKE